MYLAPADHSPIVAFSEMASFAPFDGGPGVSVATTHDARRRSSGERRVGKGQDRAGAQIRAGEAFTTSDQHAGQSARHRRLGGGFAAEWAWRRLRA